MRFPRVTARIRRDKEGDAYSCDLLDSQDRCVAAVMMRDYTAKYAEELLAILEAAINTRSGGAHIKGTANDGACSDFATADQPTEP